MITELPISNELPTCCLCGLECENKYGNNPWPLANEGVCCNTCNLLKVIPARVELSTKENKGETISFIKEVENNNENIFLNINESTGEATVSLNDVYENELANDLEILEAVNERISKKKEEIKNFIEKNKTGSFKTNKLAITYTSATTTTSIDTKLLKSELPDVAAKYSRVSSKASSVTVKLK